MGDGHRRATYTYRYPCTEKREHSQISFGEIKGVGSMMDELPVSSLTATWIQIIVRESSESASTVMLMIETADSVENIDRAAQVPGVDVILTGSNDLSIELKIARQFVRETLRSALMNGSKAARTHGKVLGLAGIYDRPDMLK